MFRFEDLASRPDDDLEDFLKGFHALPRFCSVPTSEVENLTSDLVDSWKQKLTMDEIVTIEEKCTQVLNRLEYPLYGGTF